MTADRSLRTAFFACGGACLVLGMIAASLLVLTGADSPIAWPAVTLFGGGQFIALLAAGFAGLAWLRLGRDPSLAHAVTVRRRLGLLQRAVLVWCVGATVAWVIRSPELAIAIVMLAAVNAQLTLVLGLVRRQLPTEQQLGPKNP